MSWHHFKRYWSCWISGSASTVKKPGDFEVRKSSSQVTQSQGRSQDFLRAVHFFPWKSWRPFFSRRPQNTGRQRCWLFHCQNKTNKVVRYWCSATTVLNRGQWLLEVKFNVQSQVHCQSAGDTVDRRTEGRSPSQLTAHAWSCNK